MFVAYSKCEKLYSLKLHSILGVTSPIYHERTHKRVKYAITVFIMTETVAWLCKSWQRLQSWLTSVYQVFCQWCTPQWDQIRRTT